MWSNSGGGEVSLSVQTSPGTDPAASTVGKEALTSGVKRPERGTDISSPCGAELKHQYSCTSEQLLCQSWLVMW
jgi:hypothetical protein